MLPEVVEVGILGDLEPVVEAGSQFSLLVGGSNNGTGQLDALQFGSYATAGNGGNGGSGGSVTGRSELSITRFSLASAASPVMAA